ncbi:Kallikrein-7 [Sarcoptes scabiei]|uniref:Kallikrein-7 n=1 Tax=Sarcoptes scabiei TaxID=52283 RepID=A0A834R129_SARSC|nr:Kallikrein-7 [Sarcoptes scabiei]
MFSQTSRSVSWLLLISVTIFQSLSSAIKNGHVCPIESVPYTVELIVGGQSKCGGSIVATSFVVTAASCVFRKSAWDVAIHYGSNCSMEGGKTVMARDFFFYSYDPKTYRNDIAIVRTAQTIQLDEQASRAIPLADKGFDPPKDSYVSVPGFGENGFILNRTHLMCGNFKVWDRDKCKKQYPTAFIKIEEFCAGGNDGIALGTGDAGDPAVQNDKFVGVGSYGPLDQPDPESPSVFTRVGCFFDWIMDVIHNPDKWSHN